MSCVVGLFEDGEDVLLAQDQVLLVVEVDLLALVGHLAVAGGDDLALLGLLLRGVRDDDAALLHFLLFEPLDEDAVMQRTNLHRFPTSSVLWVVPGPVVITAGLSSDRLSYLLALGKSEC